MSSLFACKIMGVRSAGIFTDIPGLMVGRKSRISKILETINKSYFRLFNYYIFLTKQMNSIINTRKRKYIIMEGLADIKMRDSEYAKNDFVVKTILYAGGLYEEYGIKMLLEAFLQLNMQNIRLDIYGDGPMKEEICNRYVVIDERIHYYGVAPNNIVIEAERNASLLVNPRPSKEDFTKYSFPSKNIEYMVSGTPILTTCLPGMPDEYYDFIYTFEKETVEGYRDTLCEILTKPECELRQKGIEAQKFILDKKNNNIQAARILDLLK